MYLLPMYLSLSPRDKEDFEFAFEHEDFEFCYKDFEV